MDPPWPFNPKKPNLYVLPYPIGWAVLFYLCSFLLNNGCRKKVIGNDEKLAKKLPCFARHQSINTSESSSTEQSHAPLPLTINNAAMRAAKIILRQYPKIHQLQAQTRFSDDQVTPYVLSGFYFYDQLQVGLCKSILTLILARPLNSTSKHWPAAARRSRSPMVPKPFLPPFTALRQSFNLLCDQNLLQRRMTPIG